MEIFKELGQCFLLSHDAFFFMWALALLGIASLFITIERWRTINQLTDYDAASLFDSIKKFIEEKKIDEAVRICMDSGKRALPRILGAGIRKSVISPSLVQSAMAEESIHAHSAFEKRLSLLMMFGNVATLLGLLGTVFGLIMSFAAVGKPGVNAIEKSALLAAGISAAMNATLVGLSISIPCVMVYSWLRTRVDMAVKEIEMYSTALLKIILPRDSSEKPLSGGVMRRGEEEEPADLEVTPMLNLMVLLIPFLLSSSEFVRIGTIEMKLPEANGGGGSGAAVEEKAKLDLGVVITAKGFTLFHYFKNDSSTAAAENPEPDIPLKDGEYDYETLSKALADVKTSVLMQIIKAYKPDISEYTSLTTLSVNYALIAGEILPAFEDHENIKIVAEEKIKYEVVVAVLDAARGLRTSEGNVTMFPNVSIAGGIVQ